jgi:hypothetical protein
MLIIIRIGGDIAVSMRLGRNIAASIISATVVLILKDV